MNSGLKEDLMYGGVSVGVSTALGAAVGYRVKKGTAPEKALPSLGPVPGDLAITAAGLAAALLSKDSKMAKGGLAVAVGSACFFGATAGQSLGKKIAEKTAGARPVPVLNTAEDLAAFIKARESVSVEE